MNCGWLPTVLGAFSLCQYPPLECCFRPKSVSRAHLLFHNTIEIININPPAGPGMRSPEPDGGLTNCLLYEETFINSHGDMPHLDECMGQQDRER